MTPDSPKTVLMIEDNPADVQLMLEALEQHPGDVRIETLPDGEAAMNYLKGQGSEFNPPRPDLVLLDINLPRKNGLEVLKEIRADVRLKDLPIVILTTSRNPADIARAYNLQANCYINKPSDFHSFEKTIQLVFSFWLGLAQLPPIA